MSEGNLTIRVTVRRMTPEGAILDLGGQTIAWPGSLPDRVVVGDSLVLHLQTEAAAGAAYDEQARAILAEILGGET